MNTELLNEFFETHFTKGKEYSGNEIRLIFETAKESSVSIPNSGNPMAFTYNRWNLGMNIIFPMFIYCGSSIYKYVGRGYDFTGAVFHHPQNTDVELYLIANFVKGKFEFIDEEISTLDDWKKSKKFGERVICVNTSFILIKESREIKCKLVNKSVEKSDSSNGFGHISTDSPLGKAILFKRKNDQIEVGLNKFTVKEII